MEKNFVLDGNKLIAEFMNLEPCKDKGFEHLWSPKDLDKASICRFKLIYHESWDWLMPVVEKIENIIINNVYVNFHIGRKSCVIAAYAPEQIMFSFIEGDKLKSCFKTIVEFIKWYNESKESKM